MRGDYPLRHGGLFSGRGLLIWSVPLSRGGTNYIENLRPACEPCNFSRGNRTA
ncbi:HNH endonuclease [Streptomyces sp. NPDC048385]|uniref:HNH endonuclease n=1 Tax=unclassified Streptomyces TaxID=2593676 RepID=UPI00341AA360